MGDQSGAGVCKEGWYSRVDFYPHASGCDQYTDVVRGLGAMVAALALLAIPIKARFTYLRIMNPMPQKYVQNVQCVCSVANIMYELSMLIYGALKVINPERFIIGESGYGGINSVNLFITVSFFVVMFTASLNLAVFLEGTMKIFARRGDKFDRIMFVITSLKRYGYALPIFGALTAVFPYLALSSQIAALGSDYILITVFLVSYYVIMTIQGIVFVLLLSLAIEYTGSYLHDQSSSATPNYDTINRIDKVHNNLVLQWRFTVGRVMLSQSWIVFAAWEPLRSKFTYYFCIQYLWIYATNMLTIRTLWNFGSNARSVRYKVSPEPTKGKHPNAPPNLEIEVGQKFINLNQHTPCEDSESERPGLLQAVTPVKERDNDDGEGDEEEITAP